MHRGPNKIKGRHEAPSRFRFLIVKLGGRFRNEPMEEALRLVAADLRDVA